MWSIYIIAFDILSFSVKIYCILYWKHTNLSFINILSREWIYG
jgi:hypothetical protein